MGNSGDTSSSGAECALVEDWHLGDQGTFSLIPPPYRNAPRPYMSGDNDPKTLHAIDSLVSALSVMRNLTSLAIGSHKVPVGSSDRICDAVLQSCACLHTVCLEGHCEDEDSLAEIMWSPHVS